MSLLLLFGQQESVQLDLPRRRRQTIIVHRRERTRTVSPLEEWNREKEHRVEALTEDDLARALREDEELLLLLD